MRLRPLEALQSVTMTDKVLDLSINFCSKYHKGVEFIVLSTANSMIVQFRRKKITQHEHSAENVMVQSSSSKLLFSSVSLWVLISSAWGQLAYCLASWACSYWWFREAEFGGGQIECLGWVRCHGSELAQTVLVEGGI